METSCEGRCAYVAAPGCSQPRKSKETILRGTCLRAVFAVTFRQGRNEGNRIFLQAIVLVRGT